MRTVSTGHGGARRTTSSATLAEQDAGPGRAGRGVADDDEVRRGPAAGGVEDRVRGRRLSTTVISPERRLLAPRLDQLVESLGVVCAGATRSSGR